MKYLLTADLHLTDRVRDDYRWGIFKWLQKEVLKNEVESIVILGDLTDSKDRHAAKFVHRIVENLSDLSELCKIEILKGNHDYLDPDYPFFKFLDYLEDEVRFICYPTKEKDLDDEWTWFIPHTKDLMSDWEEVDGKPGKGTIFLHHTFKNAKASNGQKLLGTSTKLFENWSGRIFSGDIHVPQKVGKVEYVGSPYHVHFGDSFIPRVVLYDSLTGESKDLHFPCISKHLIEISHPKVLRGLDYLRPGHQVKIRLKLLKAEFGEWSNYRKQIVNVCEDLRLGLCGVELVEERKAKRGDDSEAELRKNLSPEEVLRLFCEKEDVPEPTKNVGWRIMENATKSIKDRDRKL